MTEPPTERVPARDRYRRRGASWPARVASGLTVGLAIGLAARGFMRLLAEEGEFSWSGTLFIVVLFTVFGFVQGIVGAVRERTVNHLITAPIRVLGALSYLLLGGGAGMLMLPFLWCGSLAVWRRDWRGWLRVVLVVAAAANLVGVAAMSLIEAGVSLRVIGGCVLLAAVYGAVLWAAGPTFRPPSQLPCPSRRHVVRDAAQ